MTTASIEIKGMKELQKKMERLSKEFFGLQGSNDPRHIMKRSLYRLVFDLAKYPAKPPKSTYRRTGSLGRNWVDGITVNVSGSTIQGKIGNNREYAPLVQSERFQARVHRGRWMTDRKAVDKNRAAIEAEFGHAIDIALAGG